MDIGVWMRPEVLEHKLQAQNEKNTEQAWNLARWPTRLSEEGDHRLFVAVNGSWRGFFNLCRDALYHPDDKSTPFSLLFDTRTWTSIQHVPVKRFRGFTYKVPPISSLDTSVAPANR